MYFRKRGEKIVFIVLAILLVLGLLFLGMDSGITGAMIGIFNDSPEMSGGPMGADKPVRSDLAVFDKSEKTNAAVAGQFRLDELASFNSKNAEKWVKII